MEQLLLTSQIFDDIYLDNFKSSCFMSMLVEKLGIPLERNTDLSFMPVAKIQEDKYQMLETERKYVGRKSTHGSFLSEEEQQELPTFITTSYQEYFTLVEQTFDDTLKETPAERSFRQIMHWAFSAPLPNGMNELLDKCSDYEDQNMDIVILSAQRRYMKTFATLLLCNCLPESICFSKSMKRSNNELTVCTLTGMHYLKYLTSILNMQLKMIDQVISCTFFWGMADSLSNISPQQSVPEPSSMNLITSEEDDDDDDAQLNIVSLNSTYILYVTPLDSFRKDETKGTVSSGKRRCNWLSEVRVNRVKHLKINFRDMATTLVESLHSFHTSCNVKGASFFLRSIHVYPYTVPLSGPVGITPLSIDVPEKFIFPVGNDVKHKSTKRSNVIFIRTIQMCEGYLPANKNRCRENLVVYPIIQLAATITRLQYIVHVLPKIYHCITNSVYKNQT